MYTFKRKIFGTTGNLKYIPLASLGVSTTALGVSLQRNKQAERLGKQQQELTKKQLDAMNKLNNTLGVVNDSFQHFRPVQQQVVQQPQQQKKKGFFRRLFSVEAGGYKGNKRNLQSASITKAAALSGAAGGGIGAVAGAGFGAVAGAATGAALGAFSAWMWNIADKSSFNSGVSRNANSYNLVQVIENHYNRGDETIETSTTTSTTLSDGTVISTTNKNGSTRPGMTPKGVVYDIDENPNKYVISLLYRGNVLVMYINNPSRQELTSLNQVLDKYCYTYKNADYSSEQIRKNTYCVEVFVVEGAEENIAMSLITSGFKLNIITGNRFRVGKI